MQKSGAVSMIVDKTEMTKNFGMTEQICDHNSWYCSPPPHLNK